MNISSKPCLGHYSIFWSHQNGVKFNCRGHQNKVKFGCKGRQNAVKFGCRGHPNEVKFQSLKKLTKFSGSFSS